jgi:hypothetical protein
MRCYLHRQQNIRTVGYQIYVCGSLDNIALFFMADALSSTLIFWLSHMNWMVSFLTSTSGS